MFPGQVIFLKSGRARSDQGVGKGRKCGAAGAAPGEKQGNRRKCGAAGAAPGGNEGKIVGESKVAPKAPENFEGIFAVFGRFWTGLSTLRPQSIFFYY